MHLPLYPHNDNSINYRKTTLHVFSILDIKKKYQCANEHAYVENERFNRGALFSPQ